MFTVDRQNICDETSLNDEGRGVNITLPKQQQYMTVQQISKLRLGQFAALWTVRHLRALVTLKARRSCCHLRMCEQVAVDNATRFSCCIDANVAVTLVTSHLPISIVQCFTTLFCMMHNMVRKNHPLCTLGTHLLDVMNDQVAKHMFNSQDYIRELAMLLVQLGDRGDPSTQASMEHLTLESTRLLGCLKAFNPSVYKAVCQERLDGANTVPAQELDFSWFMSLQASRQISCCSGVCSVCCSWHYSLCRYKQGPSSISP